MNYNVPTPTDILLSRPKHLQLIGAQYTFYWNIFFIATAMQNGHGRTVLDFLMNYWTLWNIMLKYPPTGKRELFYLVLNYMGEYIHLLIQPLLNARALSCLEVHVELTKTAFVNVYHLKLLHSVNGNYCGFSQLFTNTIGSIYFPYNICLYG